MSVWFNGDPKEANSESTNILNCKVGRVLM